MYNTGSGQRVKHIYDGILKEDMSKGSFLIGYADDIAAVITARNTEEALRRVMLRTKTWLVFYGLDLVMHKTELLLITGRCIPLHVIMSIENEGIRTKSSVRHLGIRLDPILSFMYQIQYSASKTKKIRGQLSRLMAKIRGPLPDK